MYPGQGMYVGEEPLHHLPIMDDDEDDDNDHDHDHDHSSDSGHHKHKHPNPPNGRTPPPHHHHPTPPKRSPTPPPLRPQQPLQPPTPLLPPQPLQPPTPILPQPPLQPPIQLQPPPPTSSPPPPPPRKPQPPPPMDLNYPHHYNDGDDLDDDDKHKSPHQLIGAVIFIIILLLGLTFLILWLIYRPSKPHFTTVAALIYTLNTTATTASATITVPAAISASMQFIIHTTNRNKRTTLSYDHLTATVYYRSTAITPPVPLPPLYHRKHSSVIIAPVIGGPPPAVAVPVGWDVANRLLSDEAYGVVGFSWVVVGRVRYRVGGFKSGHSRVYVKCDVVVRLIGVNNGVYVNSAGQVPLLASPPCLVDI